MKYCVIDIETTGLDPLTCDILQVAAVVEDTALPLKPLKQMPSISFFVRGRDLYTGEPFALSMNHRLFKRISEVGANERADVGPILRSFVEEEGKIEGKVICAGKNFAGFDKQFLLQTPGFAKHFLMHHRTIDPMPLYLRPDDSVPPDLDECLRRAGVNMERFAAQRHEALFDCYCVVQALRYALNQYTWTGIPDNWSAV